MNQMTMMMYHQEITKGERMKKRKKEVMMLKFLARGFIINNNKSYTLTL